MRRLNFRHFDTLFEGIRRPKSSVSFTRAGLPRAQEIDVVALCELIEEKWHTSFVGFFLVHFVGENVLHEFEILCQFAGFPILELYVIFANFLDLLKESF